MKKILLTLFAALFALNVAAQENKNGTCGSNVTWTVYPNYSNYTAKLVISGSGAMSNYSNSEENKAPWYKQDGFTIWAAVITEIEIGDQITHIGNYCFYNMTNLKTVTFVGNSSCSSIGSNAFYNCTSLTTINVPESVTVFGTKVFSGCENLTNTEHIIINVDSETVGERYTFSKDVKYIEGGAFTNCEKLKYLIYEGSPKIGGNIMDSQTRDNIKITAMPSNSLNINDANCGPNRNLTKDVNIKKDKYTSYAFLHDVTIPPGVAAYTAKIDGENVVTLTRIKTGKIQAKEGVFLKATNDGEYDFYNGPDALEADDNDLVGVVEEKQLTQADKAYVLKTDVNGIQKFYLVESDIKIGEFKAYLTAVGHEAKTFSIFNVDETTNIEETEQEKEEPINSRTEIYNMAGQKLSTTQKGLNIVNGKIVIK